MGTANRIQPLRKVVRPQGTLRSVLKTRVYSDSNRSLWEFCFVLFFKLQSSILRVTQVLLVVWQEGEWQEKKVENFARFQRKRNWKAFLLFCQHWLVGGQEWYISDCADGQDLSQSKKGDRYSISQVNKYSGAQAMRVDVHSTVQAIQVDPYHIARLCWCRHTVWLCSTPCPSVSWGYLQQLIFYTPCSQIFKKN